MGFSPLISEGRLIMTGQINEDAVSAIRGVCETPAPALFAEEAAPADTTFEEEEEERVDSLLDRAENHTATIATTEPPLDNELPSEPITSTKPEAEEPRRTPLLTPVEPKEPPAEALPEVQTAEPQEVETITETVLEEAELEMEALEVAVGESPMVLEVNDPATPPQQEEEREEEREEEWACIRCTFNNTTLIIECDMCGTSRHPAPHANAACSPMVQVPEEPSRISVSSVGVSAEVHQQDAGQDTESLVPVVDAACSPFVLPSRTADASCSANIRTVKTPILESEAGLEDGLLRVRRRLAQLCNRSASGGSSSSSALQDLTNAMPANGSRQQAQAGQCPPASANVSRAGSTPLRRDLTSALECGVCLCLIVYPVTSPCGHSFCRHCLVEATAKAGKKCPSCRSPCEMDVAKCAENKLLAHTARLASPAEYTQRAKEADEHMKRLERAAATVLLPVLIGDDSPCPGSTCKLQLAEPRDVALLRFIQANRGAFVLLPSTSGSRVRTNAIGLQCTLRRTEDLSNGHTTASVYVGHRIRITSHETASEGHTSAEVELYTDSNEGTYEALAATHHLQRIVKDFFRTQTHDMQAQVERFAGPEPSLVPLPSTHQGRVPLGATRYTFWVAAVLSHLRILSKRAKPTLVGEKDCVSRATALAHTIGSAMRQTGNNQVTDGRRQAEYERHGYPARRNDYHNRGEIRAA